MDKLDLLVIGSGVAGSSTASAAREKGWKVGVADDKPFGGTCPQRGCDPKKVMAEISRIYDDANRVFGAGLDGTAALNWEDLVKHKNTFTNPIPEATLEKFGDRGIKTYQGHAKFIDDHTLQIGNTSVQADKVLIASGASPAQLPIDGTEYFTYSEDFFDLPSLPEKLVFIGGGYITFEFAHLARRVGSEVTIVHSGELPLEGFEADMVDKLVDYSRELGIQIETNAKAVKIAKNQDHYTVHLENEEVIETDLVIHGAGRKPNVMNLDLENTSIAYSEKGIKVNFNQQNTSASHVYAAGDCADDGKLPLTPLAGTAGSIVIQHLLEDNPAESFQAAQPSIVFTYPAAASVGFTEAQAQENKLDYEVATQDLSAFFTYKAAKENAGYSKILLDKQKQVIIGAHIFSSKAEHLINLFTLAIEAEIPVNKLKQIMWGYPTAESDIPSMI